MALLNDELSVWEIGFRWAGFDPDQFRFRLPLSVRDNFRVLMDAILYMHLECITLDSEKYQGTDADEAKLHIRYWLDEVRACIEGQRYNKKLLKWARLERGEFQRWCQQRSITLPEFWFPPGWALDYEWDVDGLIVGDVVTDGDVSSGEAITSGSPKNLSDVQRITIASKLVAINLWKQHPDMTITSMVKHEVIQKFCGADHYGEEAVRRWLSAVAPPAVKEKRGRPRKNGTENVE